MKSWRRKEDKCGNRNHECHHQRLRDRPCGTDWLCGAKSGRLPERKRGHRTIKSKKKYLIDIAVNAVEQIWQNKNGPVKLQKAKNEAVWLLRENGIAITDTELDTFIESSVKAMNDAFNSTKEGRIVLEVPQVDIKEGE